MASPDLLTLTPSVRELMVKFEGMVPRYGIYDGNERIDSFTLREVRRP